MTLDPRTQLAQTMLMGLAEPKEPIFRKRSATTNNQGHLKNEQDQHSIEALTQALLDPFTTVQEAVLDSQLQRAEVDSPVKNEKNRTGR